MLYVKCHEMTQREASPTAEISDNQSVKSAEEGVAYRSHGFDGSNKIKGKKRRLPVDTEGLALNVVVHTAELQDHDGGGW